jgi:DNA-binding NtrC family response regulator
MPGVLVIDDDRSVVHLIRTALRDLNVETLAAATADEGLAMLSEHLPDVLLLDIMLPEISGIELFQKIRSINERVPVIFITAGGESETAIEAMTLGALDYLLKPLDVARIKELVEQALAIRRLMETPVRVPDVMPPSADEHRLIGRSPSMLEVYKAIGRVAPQTVAVLIRGESGTGKELIARAIYQHSPRREKPFLAVNCAALHDTLLESELFGHEKGSFTGADRRRIGKFEQASGGTIFLDEVGDMAPLVQAKLLRLLQDQQFERVGGNETIQTDVRIIAATNRDLDQMAIDGTFRSDLYYRLNGFSIVLPPLRERGDDLLLLIESLLARFGHELNKPVQRISPDALKLLLEHPWPGNVRELQSVLRKSLLNQTGPVLLPDFLPEELRAARGGRAPHASSPVSTGDQGHSSDLARFLETRLTDGSGDLYAEAVEFMERQLITRVLQSTEGNQSKAAKILGITRGSLRNKTVALGIRIGQVVSSPELEEPAEEPV